MLVLTMAVSLNICDQTLPSILLFSLVFIIEFHIGPLPDDKLTINCEMPCEPDFETAVGNNSTFDRASVSNINNNRGGQFIESSRQGIIHCHQSLVTNTWDKRIFIESNGS